MSKRNISNNNESSEEESEDDLLTMNRKSNRAAKTKAIEKLTKKDKPKVGTSKRHAKSDDETSLIAICHKISTNAKFIKSISI